MQMLHVSVVIFWISTLAYIFVLHGSNVGTAFTLRNIQLDPFWRKLCKYVRKTNCTAYLICNLFKSNNMTLHTLISLVPAILLRTNPIEKDK